MAVKIRLTRLGKKKQPTYRVVVMDSRTPRDGKYIEQLGIYDPRQEPSRIEIDNERALHWLANGAQPTERARKLLEISGAWTQFKVARGDIHTVGAGSAGGGAPTATATEPTIHVVGGEVDEVDEDLDDAAAPAAGGIDEGTGEDDDTSEAS